MLQARVSRNVCVKVGSYTNTNTYEYVMYMHIELGTEGLCGC